MLLTHVPRLRAFEVIWAVSARSSESINVAVSVSHLLNFMRSPIVGRQTCWPMAAPWHLDGLSFKLSGPMQQTAASECCTPDATALYMDLEVLRKSQVMLQGIIDGEAYCCGGDHFDVIEAKASKERSRTLLLDDHAQALHC